MTPDWFKMNPSKFLQDKLIDGLDPYELGCIFRLLCRQWIDGSLPNDVNKLARVCRADATGMLRLMPIIEEFFLLTPEGTLQNRHMAEQREILVLQMEAKSRAGKQNATKRWADAVGMPDPMQDKDSKIKKTTTRKPKRAETDIPLEFVPYLEDLSNRWPRTSVTKDGNQRVTILRPIDICLTLVT